MSVDLTTLKNGTEVRVRLNPNHIWADTPEFQEEFIGIVDSEDVGDEAPFTCIGIIPKHDKTAYIAVASNPEDTPWFGEILPVEAS